MQLLFIKEHLQNIKNLEILLPNNSESILIEDMHLKLWQNFPGLKFTCNNIQLKNNKNQFHIIDKIFISINFNKIYRKITEQNNELPIFYLYANGVDISKVQDCYTISNKNKPIKTNNIFFAKIVKVLNQKNIKNFKVKVEFKNFNLPSDIGNLQVRKVSFANINLDKDYVGGLKLVYSLNGEHSVLYGFVHKNALNLESNILPLDQESISYNKLILEFYGYINSSIITPHYVMNPKEFYKILLTYNINDQDLEFTVDLRSLNLKINNIPSMSGENLKILARYNLNNKTLHLKEFKVDLLSGISTIPISGSATIDHDGSFELIAKAQSLIDQEVIYSLWPDIAKKQKDFLQSIIIDTKIRNPVFLIQTHKKSNAQYNIDNLQLDFKLEKTTLNKNIKGYNYRFDTDKASVQVNLDTIQIQSEIVYLENNIAINNLAILIPVDFSKKTLCDFELNTTNNSIQRLFNRYLDDVELLKGDLKLNIHSEFPIQKFAFKDVILSGKVIADGVNIMFYNKKRDFSSQNLVFALKNYRLSCTGDVIYNDVKFKQLELLGDIYEDHGELQGLRLKSANLKINLNQDKIQKMMSDLHSEVDGTLYIQVLDSKTIRFNLNDVAIFKTPINFKKQLGVASELDFMVDSEEVFKNIHLKLPEVEAIGDCEVANNKLINLNLQFKKLYNSRFNITYSKSDNIYRIDASVIYIEDIKMIVDHLSIEKKILNADGKIMDLEQEITLVINADYIFLEQKVILENLSLNLNLKSNKIVKIDGYGYAKDKNGYIRIFFDSPVFALIVNNLGYLTDETLKIKTVNKGNLGLYLSLADLDINGEAIGDLYLYNFKLLESYLVSTILKIYALSGFGVNNIFQMFNNGINFSNMHCAVSANHQSMFFENCQAFSDAMLLSAEAKLDLHSYKGELQGLIIPKNFLNAPIIFLQQILSKKGKTLLDDMQDRQNFSITWSGNGKPIIQTNPISFILPSIFSNFFSKKKTVKKNQIPHEDLTGIATIS